MGDVPPLLALFFAETMSDTTYLVVRKNFNRPQISLRPRDFYFLFIDPERLLQRHAWNAFRVHLKKIPFLASLKGGETRRGEREKAEDNKRREERNVDRACAIIVELRSQVLVHGRNGRIDLPSFRPLHEHAVARPAVQG